MVTETQTARVHRTWLDKLLLWQRAYQTRIFDEPINDLMGLLLWLMMLGFYIIPTLVAWSQQHQHWHAISALNLLLGWTLVGWFCALAWSFKREEPLPKNKKRRKRTARMQPDHPVATSDLARRLAELREVSTLRGRAYPGGDN